MISSASRGEQTAVAKATLAAKTVADVDRLSALISKLLGDCRWRSVGDIDDNLGPIHASADPRLALNERYTNGIDAILELEARLRYANDIAKMAQELPNPKIAAQRLLKVPMAGPGAMSNADRQRLAERVTMTLLESGNSDRPTCVIQDAGIGQAPSQVPGTILSIHRGNKQDKPFLMGVYGWGGSAALGYAERTVLLCRRHPEVLDGADDGAAVTTVKKVYKEGMRTPAYKYLVGADGEPLALDPRILEDQGFKHGAYIAHVEYDLMIKGPLINQYNFFNAALFEPVMPVYLGSYRNADKTKGRRTLVGSGGRLKSSDPDGGEGGKTRIAYKQSATIELDPHEGQVRANIWVLDKEGANPTTDTVQGFVSADSAITVTLNGQRQETEKREWIKRNCKLPHLYKRMIIQIEADGLTQETKAETFSTTRERLRGRMRERIFGELEDLLTGNADLEALESALREEALKHTAEKASEKDLERLRKAIGKLGGRTREMEVEVEVEAEGPEKARRRRPSPPRDTSDGHLPEVPTQLEFDRHALDVEQGGRRRRVVVEIDAKNGYLPQHDDDLHILVEGPNGETRDVYPHTRTELLGGTATWLIGASPDAAVGDYKLIATLRVGNQELTDSIAITVVEGRERDGRGGRGKGRMKKKAKEKRQVPVGPEVNWIKRDGWDEHDYTATTVGHVDESDRGVDIYLNLDFDKLFEVLSNPRYTPPVVEARKSAYMVPTALGLYRIHQLDNENDLPDDVVRRMQTVVADSVLLATDPEGVLGMSAEEAED